MGLFDIALRHEFQRTKKWSLKFRLHLWIKRALYDCIIQVILKRDVSVSVKNSITGRF